MRRRTAWQADYCEFVRRARRAQRRRRRL